MPRLIDADALIDDVTERYCNNCERRKGIKNGKQKVIYDIGDAPCRACAVDDMKDELENAPTVDAEPVRHGHWVRHLDTRFGRKLNDTIRCSCCGITFSTEDMIRRSYCPNCKAKMDEEEK